KSSLRWLRRRRQALGGHRLAHRNRQDERRRSASLPARRAHQDRRASSHGSDRRATALRLRAGGRQGWGLKTSLRVDLWPALTLLLMANRQREIEQRAKAVFERCVALDLAANVTDDAAKPRAQKLQFPPRAFELVGMRVAPHHDGGTLG